MTKQLQQKVEAAKKAIDAVHSDESGPASDNLEAIQDVLSHGDMLNEALEADVHGGE